MELSKNLTFFAYKNVKYLFYKFNDYLLFNGLNTVPLRHSRINENKIVMEEIQNRDWQYLVELVIKLVEHDKSHLKPRPRAESKIIKSMKHNYRIARRVYASTYASMAEQFKVYLNSLPPDKIDEIEKDFRTNGNCLLSVRQVESATELFDSFAMFHYINDRVPNTDEHRFVPDGETRAGIIGEKLSLKEPFAKFFRTGSNTLVSSSFLAALLLYFARKETIAKIFLTELYKNLTVEVLSSDNSENSHFVAITELCAELSVRLGNFIFANHQRARLDMKRQTEEISKKYDFFDVKIKNDTEMDDIETIPHASLKRENNNDDIEAIPYSSPKRENDIDDRETIACGSPRRESEDEIDGKIYKGPKRETAFEIEKQIAEREKKIIKS